MKTFQSLPTTRFSRNFLLSFAIALLFFSCSDQADVKPGKAESGTYVDQNSNTGNASARSTGTASDYNISLTVDGLIWTYVITKNPGAKDLSHFILNFQNCNGRSATISNIVWATVNGQPAVLESSEGNTGCNVSAVTTNFVKFDDLPGATSYTIVFQTDVLYGNFVGTTAWLKAGKSCFAYPVLAPCCPL